MSIWVKTKKSLNALYMIVSVYNQVYRYSNPWRSCYVCDKKFVLGF